MIETGEGAGAEPGARAPAAPRRRRHVSIAVTLAVSISSLVLVAVVSVLGLGLWSASENTMDLLRDKAQYLVDSTLDRVRTQLRPAEQQADFLAALIARGALDPADEERFAAMLTGALAAAPQISAVLLMGPDYQAVGVARNAGEPAPFRADFSADAEAHQGIAAARVVAVPRPVWGPPLWRAEPGETILNLRRPVVRGGTLVGVLIATVTVRDLSQYLAGLDTTVGSNVFILYDRTSVLAHPNLASGVPGMSERKPLPSLAETGDPVLASIWRRDGREPLRVTEGTELDGHMLRLFNESYIFIYREVEGLGGRPWLIGSYFRAADVGAELRRLAWAASLGVAMLLVSVAAAVFLGRRIARPIVRLAGAASQIGHLEISETAELPGSVFRELDDQARAFNAMLRGLRWFETYVPRKLVARLIGHGGADAAASHEREVTVMFTDIAGFTGLSQGQPAAQVADFLNRHFACLAACIEDEDGTVDKFIGDSVMAFWGAPEAQPDHAARAGRAALAIVAALAVDNERRRGEGREPVRVRIGLHSGPATVGNIGAPGRINYTIVGDTVNVAQRLEVLGKDLTDDGAEVCVLASGTTAAALGPAFAPVPLGRRRLRGRDRPVEVFRLA